MKQCPTCQRTYTDDTLAYCLDDGSVLAAAYDPQATQIIAPPRRTDPMPTAVFLPPTQTAQQQPAPFAHVQPQPAPRQGVNPVVVYVLVALLALVVGGGVVALLLRPAARDETASSSNLTPKPQDAATTASREPATKEQQSLPATGNLSTPTPLPVDTPRPQPSTVAAQPRQEGVPGNYPEASTRNLNESELAAKSCFELKIMRNEIYARHGYIFKTDDMRAHFSRQNWYRPLAADVSGQLSGVERRNTQLIKQYESGKGCS